MIRGKIYRPLDTGIVGCRALDIIKWLRQQGVRGTDWDFAGGGGRNLSIWFNNDQLEVLYILKWE